jgi:hypothetical protein
LGAICPIAAEVAFARKEKMMEDLLREPMELSEAELDEIAGGGGCEQSCHSCGCDGGGISVAVALAAAVAIAL